MAWGNFLTLPCPYKRWDSKLKNLMLAFLPSVGAVAGGLWALIAFGLAKYEAPVYLSALVMSFFIFAVCGFMHLDGFMDCNDAILSRRPLEDRQRILKDSTVGAFAVVTAIFLILAWFAATATLFDGAVYDEVIGGIFLIPIVGRFGSATAVLNYEPLSVSQYAEDHKEKVPARYTVASIVELIVYFGIVTAILGFVSTRILITMGVGLVAYYFACLNGRKQLGGMNGDIAGYSLCISELCAMIALSLVA